MVAVQRLADLSGLARLAASKLSIHPLYGPWVAFRAVAVLDIRGPSGSAPGAAPACDACEASCLPAFRRARDVWMSHATGEAGWRAWLAVRESCPVGREYRYCDAQIEYHYTKDRAILRRALHGR
jgi:methylmalonic aciduria homocystinuria type C protein